MPPGTFISEWNFCGCVIGFDGTRAGRYDIPRVYFINLVCAILLMNLRKADSALTRGAWLAARNDVLANLLILAAGVVTVFWFSAWPDIVVGLVIGVINLTAAKEVYEQARAEDPELEMDDDDD